jgi:hypothetical protein
MDVGIVEGLAEHPPCRLSAARISVATSKTAEKRMLDASLELGA